MKAYERLLKYAVIKTPSDETSTSTPSSACQFDLANPLKKEMFYEIDLDTTKKLRVYDESEQFIGIYYWKKNMFFPDKIFYDNNQ